MAGTSPYLSCNFSIEPSRRVLQTQDINCGVDMNSTWVLYLFTGISLSPFNSMNALEALKSELDQLSQTKNGEFLYAGKGTRVNRNILSDIMKDYAIAFPNGLSYRDAARFIMDLENETFITRDSLLD